MVSPLPGPILMQEFPKDLCYVQYLFYIHLNDLSDGLSSNTKLFADDTSLFSVVLDVNESAIEFNSDLKKSMIGPFSGQ